MKNFKKWTNNKWPVWSTMKHNVLVKVLNNTMKYCLHVCLLCTKGLCSKSSKYESTHTTTQVLIPSARCECLPRSTDRQRRGVIKPVNPRLFTNSLFDSLHDSILICICCRTSEGHFFQLHKKSAIEKQYQKLQQPLIQMTGIYN